MLENPKRSLWFLSWHEIPPAIWTEFYKRVQVLYRTNKFDVSGIRIAIHFLTLSGIVVLTWTKTRHHTCQRWSYSFNDSTDIMWIIEYSQEKCKYSPPCTDANEKLTFAVELSVVSLEEKFTQMLHWHFFLVVWLMVNRFLSHEINCSTYHANKIFWDNCDWLIKNRILIYAFT